MSDSYSPNGSRVSRAGESSVLIILGSPADQSWGDKIVQSLSRYGVEAEIQVASAHKTPEYLLSLLKEREQRGGPRVYITVAGRSNALSGFVDAQVLAPVIACPPSSDSFGGMDILSSLRMPRGVAPLVVLEPENAALAAAKMLGLVSPQVQEAIAGAQEAERQRVIGAPS
jgi:phosphoribosylaminoimidazole carboxylase PurE protein